MAEDGAITREDLFREACAHWQRTEDAIAALGAHFETPAYEGWTIGDIFRHLTAANHDIASRVRTLIATGELPFPGDAGNAAALEKFRALDHKMLRIELNTAHGVVWMYIQRFSDEDLAQPFTVLGEAQSLGAVIRYRVLHEVGHVNEALAAAGLDESAITPVETAHRWA